MGTAASVPKTRAEKWSFEDIVAASRVFFDKEEFVQRVVEADSILQEEARSLGGEWRLDGATIMDKLTEADYKRLGFARIGWPSWTSVTGQIREIHKEQDDAKRKLQQLQREEAERAKHEKREARRIERENLEREIAHRQRVRNDPHKGAAADPSGNATDGRQQEQEGQLALQQKAGDAVAPTGSAQSTGDSTSDEDDDAAPLAPGDFPRSHPEYDPKGWIDPESGRFVKRKPKPDTWWKSGKHANRVREAAQAKVDVQKRAIEQNDPCILAVYLDAAQPLEFEPEADALYLCGCNNAGQLGQGDAMPRPRLTRIPPDVVQPCRVRQVACGNAHTVVATAEWDAAVLTFGDNTLGQLGLGHTRSQMTPQCVARLRGLRVTHLACGSNHTICATAGKVRDTTGASNSPMLYAWGNDQYGELGLGKGQMSTQNSPMPLRSFDQDPMLLECGASFNVIVTTHDQIYTWGCNDHGQLGHGAGVVGAVDKPRRLESMSGKRTAAVRCGGAHVVLITVMDTVYGWGDNTFDQLGLGHERMNCDQRDPTVLMRRALTAMACGDSFTLLATASEQDGVAVEPEVLGFGANDMHQLGRGGRLTDVQGKHIVQLECGHRHVLARTGDGALWCWGANGSGQLGLGKASSSQADPFAPGPELCGKRDSEVVLASLRSSHHTAMYRPSEYVRVPPRPATPTAAEKEEMAAVAAAEKEFDEQGMDEQEKKAARFLWKRERQQQQAKALRAEESLAKNPAFYHRLPLKKSQAFKHLEPETLPGMK